MLDVISVIAGLALLLVGGELIVRGASNLAKRLGVSPMVIGLTVVAFGTSVPELAVNVSAALSGSSQLCFGNVIGSNIANIGLVLGCAALIAPLNVQKPVVMREVPIMLLSVLVVTALGLDHWLDGVDNAYSRSDAIVLLMVFGVFLYSTGYHVVTTKDQGAKELAGVDKKQDIPPVWKSALLALVGLFMLTFGGDLTVDGAVALARDAGISEVVIGLTVVSVGTSLPELVTSVMATRRNEADLAVGNIVGSNIFNLLLVLGTSNAITPTTLPAGAVLDLGILALMSFLLVPLALTGWILDRKEGGMLLLLYISFVSWRVWDALAS